ncbi:hypothetical protein [Micromonospora sp. WMMD710]|uniref:hypothetical protein n=1 Tax=Micromonospora sp. WMMD710 TaxID=3016085 RepID=UPI0024160A00|nr:hypothetical protein [Micromonospora sp. WMMD710]MDG4760366.1 hypothetical protein [Micromonospora sp. WMMD710]
MPDESTHDDGERTLQAGEVVTVGPDLVDEISVYLYVVIDGFSEPLYTVARLGGDGYQWPNIDRGQLHPVMPQRITRVHDASGEPAYVAG